MGQYWQVVNLDKHEFINPHKLGCGLKLWEQLANTPGTGTALIILCAAMPEPRGGGDFDLDDNWHGPERDTEGAHGCTPGPMPEDYPTIAKRTIGRWAGNRIALVGDYGEPGDLPPAGFGLPRNAEEIYFLCRKTTYPDDYPELPPSDWVDVSDDVCRVIEHELGGEYVGEGWRHWQPAKED